MKYIVYLATLLLFSTAKAQNPTIIKGDYVSNVFGQSNFVLNPNAQTGIGNISSSSATVTRSTTTPLVATTEFNWSASAGGFSTWSLRAFDAGMKNQNCEARFTYRGFTAGTTTAQVRNSGIVIAELVLTPSATDPRTASINFPCGDLSLSTNFRLLQSGATLGGINEIGGIYVGLATNMANIAQAENVVRVTRTGAQTVGSTSAYSTFVYNTKVFDVYDEFDTSTGVFTAKRSGKYMFNASMLWADASWSAGHIFGIGIRKGSVLQCETFKEVEQTQSAYQTAAVTCSVDVQVGEQFNVGIFQVSGTNKDTYLNTLQNWFEIYRFPSSSELVVTPETQNVFAAAKWTGGSTTSVSTTTRSAITTFTGYTPYGKASSTAPVSSMEMTVANIPPGSYKLKTSLQFVSEVTSVGTIDCYLEMSDDGGSTYKILQGNTVTYQSAQAFSQVYGGSVFLNYTSLQSSKTFKIFVRKAGGAAGNCRAQVDSSNTNIILEPLDNNSNSALYVQGPVKAAGTGAAIPAGYVGEEKLAYTAPSTFTTAADTPVVIPSASITLEPGVWDVSYTLAVGAYRAPPSTAAVFCRVRMLENGSLLADTESLISFHPGVSSAGNLVSSQSVTKRVLITSATKTYTVDLTANFASTTAQCYVENGQVTSGISGNDSVSYIRAVRIN
jgi:hypothetical protein